jgi:hypothetical protein
MTGDSPQPIYTRVSFKEQERMTRLSLALAVWCFMVLGSTGGAYAGDSPASPAQGQESRTLALVLDFSTCSALVNQTYTCDLADSAGKPAGTIRVTLLGGINSNSVSTSSRESWFYDLKGGTISVENARAWQVVGAAAPDENGLAPAALGFGLGEIDGGTGRFHDATGVVTMRWDGEKCICLIEFA